MLIMIIGHTNGNDVIQIVSVKTFTGQNGCLGPAFGLVCMFYDIRIRMSDRHRHTVIAGEPGILLVWQNVCKVVDVIDRNSSETHARKVRVCLL